jgi:hypothetical protein
MTEIDGTLDPFVEAEIKEHHARIVREIVTIVIIICVMLICGLASLIYEHDSLVLNLMWF